MELHWTIRPGYCSFPLDPDELWERHEWVAVAGTPTRALAPEDHLLVLCVHASWHLWARLRWIGDIAALILSRPDLDWDSALGQARRLGSERMLLLGLRLAHDLLGAPLPAPVLARVSADPAVGSLVRYVQARLFQERGGLPPVTAKMAERAFQLRMRERWRDRVGYALLLARETVTTGPADREGLPLPRALSPLYYLTRPIRLAGKYGVLWSKRLVSKRTC